MLRIIANKKIAIFFLVFFLFTFGAKFLYAQSYQYPNDPYYKNQWYLNKIGYNYIWNAYIFRGQSPVLAIIDSGIDIDHPDLKENIWTNKLEIKNNSKDNDLNGFIDDINGWNFVENNNNPRPVLNKKAIDDGLNHGTMIAGIISAKTNNGIGISGIASNTKIMPLRALDEKGEGKINDVIRAIDYAINNGADIINLSFSGNDYSQAFKNAINRANKAGVIVVSAVGNNNFNLNESPAYPACFNYDTNLVAVSALDSLDQKASFSSYGSECVDISAPGTNFFSTYFYNEENSEHIEYMGYWSGTSMATAVVSASLALIKEVNPKLNSKELLEVLFKSSDNINLINPNLNNQLGVGKVNVFNSVRWADEKWKNLLGNFLIYPQLEDKNYQDIDKIKNLRLSDKKGNLINIFESDNEFSFGLDIKTGDLNMSGSQEIIIGSAKDSDPYVRIFDVNGKLISEFLAYHSNFRGGVNIAIGDIDGDGIPEIITGAGFGGGPHVRIFDIDGNLKGQFFAYDPNFRGGVNVAIGDIDGSGSSEIITSPGIGGGPHIKIFDKQANLKGQFFAYEEDFRGGVKISVANIYGKKTNNRKEIVVAPGTGRLAEIKIFNNFGKELKNILAYSEKFKNGVNLSVADLNKDGLDEIITGAGPGGTPHVRAFDGGGNLTASFYALDENFSGGVVALYIENN